MKVVQEGKTFKPVFIELEYEAEVKQMRRVLSYATRGADEQDDDTACGFIQEIRSGLDKIK
jgi:hypothetical protein